MNHLPLNWRLQGCRSHSLAFLKDNYFSIKGTKEEFHSACHIEGAFSGGSLLLPQRVYMGKPTSAFSKQMHTGWKCEPFSMLQILNDWDSNSVFS